MVIGDPGFFYSSQRVIYYIFRYTLGPCGIRFEFFSGVSLLDTPFNGFAMRIHPHSDTSHLAQKAKARVSECKFQVMIVLECPRDGPFLGHRETGGHAMRPNVFMKITDNFAKLGNKFGR